MKYISLLALLFILPLASCAEETFESTCIGFSKRWNPSTEEKTQDHLGMCRCVEKELSGLSPESKETLRHAMSAGILSQHHFDNAINEAIQDNKLTEKEHQTYEMAAGQCFGGISAAEEEVDDMIQKFKALQ